MQLKQFMEEIRKETENQLGDEITVTINQVTKNNGVLLDGITIERKGSNVYPNIYLNELYEEYKGGRSIRSITAQVIAAYESGKIEAPFDMDFFKDYSKVKNNIVFKLVNFEKNEELLKKIPHIRFLDLAIVFYYLLKNDTFQNANILINKQHSKMWNVNQEDLFVIAKKNAIRLLPGEIRNMEEIMREMLLDNLKDEFQEAVKRTMEDSIEVSFRENHLEEVVEQMLASVRNDQKKIPMYVLSNQTKIHGAACILYNGILKEFAQMLQCDIYILPSSVHEVILIPSEQKEDPCKLSNMVREVNGSELEEEEILSDHVYYYSREQGNITLCDGRTV